MRGWLHPIPGSLVGYAARMPRALLTLVAIAVLLTFSLWLGPMVFSTPAVHGGPGSSAPESQLLTASLPETKQKPQPERSVVSGSEPLPAEEQSSVSSGPTSILGGRVLAKGQAVSGAEVRVYQGSR